MSNRETMPICTKFIDHMRDTFGKPVAIKATEGGKVVEWYAKGQEKLDGVFHIALPSPDYYSKRKK